MTTATQNEGVRAFRVYLYTAGTILTLLVFALQLEPERFGLVRQADWVVFAMLGCFALITRFLSIQAPIRQITVILDTPVYLTAVITLGTIQGTLVVYTSMVTYFVWRLILRRFKPTIERRPYTDLVGVMIYSSSMTTLVIAFFCIVFGVDDHAGGLSETPDYGLIPVIGLCFLLGQYSLAVVPYLLRGLTLGRIVRKVILPGLAVEVILLQMAVVAVITYDRDDLTPFLLLSTTYIFVNYVIRRLSQLSNSQQRQVQELEALNRLAQVVSFTKDAPELFDRFAEETLGLFTAAEIFVLYNNTLPEEDPMHYAVHGMNNTIRVRFPEEKAREFALAVCKDGAQVLDVQSSASWMGVPIQVKGENVGSVVLWSSVTHSFADDELRCLSTLAHQVTVALENVRLYDLATVDSLTGLYLRRFFEDRLKEEFARVDRYHGSCSVIALDLDWLKTLNDKMGHATGDAALCHVAHVVREQTRLLDVPARLGGDEFAILLPNVGASVAVSVAERIRACIADTPVTDGQRQVNVTVSMGVASYPEHPVDSPEALMELADKALYQSKLRPERNRVEVIDTKTL